MRHEQLSVGELEVDNIVGPGGSSAWRKRIYLNAALGSDGNDGLAFDRPLKTLTVADDKITTLKKDCIVLEESASAISLATAYDWTYSMCGLVGTAQNRMNQRSRIGMSTAFTPFLTFSGYGNYFANLYGMHGAAAADLVGYAITGHRNTFDNVHFGGPMIAGQSATGYIGTKITATETTFKNCTFGTNTIALTGAYPVVQLNCPSNGYTYTRFEDCTFMAMVSAATPVFFSVVNTSGEIYAEFSRCKFIATSSNMATTMTAAFAFTGGYTAGMFFDNGCQFYGVTTPAATGSMTYM